MALAIRHLPTPGTCTVATTNNIGATHTHAITASSAPGAAAALLKTDASGYLQIERLGLGISPTTYQLQVFHATNDTDIRITTAKADGQAGVRLKNDAREWRFFCSASDSFSIRDITGSQTILTLSPGCPGLMLFVDVGAIVLNEPGNDVDFRVEGVGNAYALFVQGSDSRVAVGTNSPAGQLHVDQPSTTGAAPVLVLDQADVDQVLAQIIATAAQASADRTLVAASDFTTPGALVGWIQINVQDIGNRIADGDYYIPIHAAPTA